MTSDSTLRWMRRSASNLSVTILFISVLAAFAFITYTLVDTQGRQSNDEASSCAIQARGLPANKQLALINEDFYKLLTLPPVSTAQKLAATNTPISVKVIVKDLTAHLADYERIESKQPATRSC